LNLWRFWLQENWFLSHFRLLLEESKVLGSTYNFEELIWSNQELNCIIIEVWWLIRDLIETIRNQGPNQKSAKIKGSNYNSSRGFITKLSKQPRTESKIFIQKFWNGIVFLKSIIHCLLQRKLFSAVKQGYVLQQIVPIIGHVLWLLSCYMHITSRPLPAQGCLWPI